MAMRDETRMLLESMSRLFEDKCTKQVVDAAEKGNFADELWRAVSETGVPLAALPESAGGADARMVRPLRGVARCRHAMRRRSRWRRRCWPAGLLPLRGWN